MLGNIMSALLGIVLGLIIMVYSWEEAIDYIPYENVVVEEVFEVQGGLVVRASFEKTGCFYQSMEVIQSLGEGELQQREWGPYEEEEVGNRPEGRQFFSILVKTDIPDFGELLLVTRHLCKDEEKNGVLTASREQAGSFHIEEVPKVFAIINLEE